MINALEAKDDAFEAKLDELALDIETLEIKLDDEIRFTDDEELDLHQVAVVKEIDVNEVKIDALEVKLDALAAQLLEHDLGVHEHLSSIQTQIAAAEADLHLHLSTVQSQLQDVETGPSG
jgi:hypothetical protein